jgi:hypothetical protein
MQALSRYNKGFKFLLFVIDIFSKFLWVIPVKDKSGPIIKQAFQDIFQESKPRKPEKIQTDKGKEFFNKPVHDLFEKEHIHHFASNSDKKAAIVERVIRTIKSRIWTYFTAHQSRNYIEKIKDFVQSYNKSYHRSIGMAPIQVTQNKENRIWQRLYGDGGFAQTEKKTSKLEANDKVRINDVKGQFEKGYIPNWSEEHFLIEKPIPGKKRQYKIKDYGGEDIKGSWYKEELQKIRENKYLIEKIIRKRKLDDGTKEILVKWKGWPVKFNSWIPEDDTYKIE